MRAESEISDGPHLSNSFAGSSSAAGEEETEDFQKVVRIKKTEDYYTEGLIIERQLSGTNSANGKTAAKLFSVLNLKNMHIFMTSSTNNYLYSVHTNDIAPSIYSYVSIIC